jgi:ribonuclease VapC
VSDFAVSAVLDASALLALIRNEPGAARVGAAVDRGAAISAVNWAEVLSKLIETGGDPETAAMRALTISDLGAGGLTLVGFDDEQARVVARLRNKTRSLGLSLADRAALALAQLRGLPVLTTDRAWRALRLAVKVEVIR